ncbi:hypothetical protein JYT36_00455 [Bacteroidales bacterium AH-315-N07]|nr:hypothetical protein [Bacteroidales bacterium AH-315-N07]
MKKINKIKSFLTIFMVAFVLIAYGQLTREKLDTLPRPFSCFKTNPLPILWGPIPFTSEYRLIYETAVSYDQTTMFGISYLGPNLLLYTISKLDTSNRAGFDDFIIRGLRIQAAHKFYLSKKLAQNRYNPYGFYLGPYLSYSKAKITNQFGNVFNVNIIAHYFNIDAIFGFQYAFDDIFVIDLFTGIGYRNNFFEENLLNQNSIFRFPVFPWDSVRYIRNLKILLGFNFGFTI